MQYCMTTYPKPFILGLAGGSGSGKTTLTKIISHFLPWKAVVVPLDRFYKDLSRLSIQERTLVNFDHPDSLDYLEAAHVVRELMQHRIARIPHYNFSTYNREPTAECIYPAPLIIVEGMHALLHLPLLELYDVSVFLNIDEGTRFQRKCERDIAERGRTYDSVLHMWRTYTKPMHDVHVQPTMNRANILFTHTFTPRVIETIRETIEHKMHMANNEFGIVP